jgi:hypothetical protein
MHTARSLHLLLLGMLLGIAFAGSACVKSPPERDVVGDAGVVGSASPSAAPATPSAAPAPLAPNAAGTTATKRATLAFKDQRLWACYETPGVMDDSKTPEGWVSIPGKLCVEAVTEEPELAMCTIQVKTHVLIAHYYELHGEVEKGDCLEKNGAWVVETDAGAPAPHPFPAKPKRM